MRSLKVSPERLKKIKEARDTRGLAIDHPDWLEEASTFIPPVKNGKKVVPATVSIGTWKRFLQGTPVKHYNLWRKSYTKIKRKELSKINFV